MSQDGILFLDRIVSDAIKLHHVQDGMIIAEGIEADGREKKLGINEMTELE